MTDLLAALSPYGPGALLAGVIAILWQRDMKRHDTYMEANNERQVAVIQANTEALANVASQLNTFSSVAKLEEKLEAGLERLERANKNRS